MKNGSSCRDWNNLLIFIHILFYAQVNCLKSIANVLVETVIYRNFIYENTLVWQVPIRKHKMGLYTKRLHDIQYWMTIDLGRSLSIRKLSYLSWLIAPCCGWTDCQEWICFYKHPVSMLHLTDVLGMNFTCLDLLCSKKSLKHGCWSWDFCFSLFIL